MGKRSKAMQGVIQRLVELKSSMNKMGQRLNPPRRRQTIAGWHDVPEDYISQVSKITGLPPEQIRPDLARHFQKKTTKSQTQEVTA